MTPSRIGWTAVGQVADVLQIASTVFGVGAVVLTAIGTNPFTDPDGITLVVAAVTFAIVGTIAIVAAFARNRQDDAGFSEGRRATSRTLYTVGVLMSVLAVGVGLFLALRPELPMVPRCPTP